MTKYRFSAQWHELCRSRPQRFAAAFNIGLYDDEELLERFDAFFQELEVTFFDEHTLNDQKSKFGSILTFWILRILGNCTNFFNGGESLNSPDINGYTV